MGQLKPGDCVITDARGQLCCQKVIHAVGPKYEKDKLEQASAQLSKAVKGSLELAEIHGCISVALPSIGRGLGCFSHKQCELTIVKAVKEYCDEKCDDITLQKIHFVNNDDTAVQDMVAAVKQEFGNHGVTHSQQGPTIAHKPPVFQPTGSDMYLYHVETNEGLDIVLKKGNIEFSMVIVNTVPPDLNLDRGTVSKAILRAAGPKLQQLINAQGATGNLGEIIVTEGCQLYSKKVFHAIAPHWDKDHGTGEKVVTGDITTETTDIIVSSSNENFTLKHSKTLSPHLGAKSNPGMIMTQPGNLKCKKILHLVGQTDPVKINKLVKDALQMCVKTSYTSVSFPAIGTDENVPEHWQHMPAKTTCQAFAVQAKTSEYDEILKMQKNKMFSSQIERIQNPGLWKSLQLKKRDMEVRNGHQNNERRLFHGTCDTTVPIINDRGFNRSYAGKNAASYGNGTYFAVNASYSANDTYSKPNQNGEKFMYVCRVLTGDFTLGQKGMVTPPAKKHGSTDLYDSVVDNVANPTMFVVFHDTQAYPEYLITFK
uniref:Poly [ADP-ribose] polymerase n=1 Tax=Oreochromis aureus TaxID=47969 RepID=A0A668UKH0_OREAU